MDEQWQPTTKEKLVACYEIGCTVCLAMIAHKFMSFCCQVIVACMH
jgi:hypothetical protein